MSEQPHSIMPATFLEGRSLLSTRKREVAVLEDFQTFITEEIVFQIDTNTNSYSRLMRTTTLASTYNSDRAKVMYAASYFDAVALS